MTKMTTKDRRRYDPVRIFMIEPQKSQLILSTSRAGPNLMEILVRLLLNNDITLLC